MKNMSQLKSRTHSVGGSLQKFATAIEQLAHRAYPAVPKEVPKEEVIVDTIGALEDR
jgi:hypothetical protein